MQHMYFNMKLISLIVIFISFFSTAFTAESELAGEIVRGTLPIYGNDAFPIYLRRASPVNAPRARYPGFHPQSLVLKKGTIRSRGALELPCDIIFERDVPVTLRDGVVMYTDIFRPIGNGTYPAIVAWSPYGKEIGAQALVDYKHTGVNISRLSQLQKFEGPDPAYWVCQGYIVLNPDSRGAFSSQGNITYWGRQLAEDGYDFIEWSAQQPWSSGRVGMSGNSWLAASQWFIAAERPPHLTAIAPWSGFSDLFREVTNRGGVPAPGFEEAIITRLAGESYIEDVPRMCTTEYLDSPYWHDKKARLERISIPAYIVASYTDSLHTHGTFEGYRRISSSQKWLRVHNSTEWHDYYQEEHVKELRAFFDHFLKGIKNGWESTPPVRISILDWTFGDENDAIQTDWPVPQTTPSMLYLSGPGALSTKPISNASVISYDVATSTGVNFTFEATEHMDIIGYMKLRLWVEAKQADDMDLSVKVEKLSADGRALRDVSVNEDTGVRGATGLLRVSARALDTTRSTEAEPYLFQDREQILNQGRIVPVDIGLWPSALRIHANESIIVTIAPAAVQSTDLDTGTGTAIIRLAAHAGTYEPGINTSFLDLGGTTGSDPPYVNNQRVRTPLSPNRGTHVIHYGGHYDSHLLVPIVTNSN
ncbi:Cocaine esterase [Fusarium oxysporum f. sp. rapae]|uniref:Cocaine esterase n=1 Tax=Fusarium oxysporum f. sp. rapae TaxID=485398 RepID=A0A8J5TQ37_FUSOX|nr:Cocaine esterase [Fusarium oxysporum f. sp. rapae]